MKPYGYTSKAEVGEGGEGTCLKSCRKPGAEVRTAGLGLVCLFMLDVLSLHLFPIHSTTHRKHLQHLRQCGEHLEGPRDVGDNSCPPGLCSLVEMSVRGSKEKCQGHVSSSLQKHYEPSEDQVTNPEAGVGMIRKSYREEVTFKLQLAVWHRR